MGFYIKSLLYFLCIISIGIGSFYFYAYFTGVKSKTRAVEHGLRHGILIAGDKNQYMTITNRMKYYKAPAVSIAVINKDKLEWAKGYGSISSASDSKKIDTNTLFQAASVSKPVTAIGALILVQQGKLSLDENVNAYLKSWKIPDNEFTKKEKVTLRRLLSHTAGTSVHGFPGYSSCTPIPSIIEILDGKKPRVYTDPVRVTQIPGTEVCYSGGGITIVQLLIEDVTGEKFDTWMKNNVLIPFGMNASTFRQPLTQPESDLAAYGHDANGKPVNGKWHIYPEMAAAGLWTSPTDLAHFLIMIARILHGNQTGPVSQELIKEALKSQIHETRPNKSIAKGGVGLGVFLQDSGDKMFFGHNGLNEGFISHIASWPELGKGFVIMINNDSAQGLMDEIGNSVADTYGLPGLEPLIKNTVQLDQSLYPKFTGIYKDGEHAVTINMRNNSLFLLDSYMPREMQLYPAGDNIFFTKEEMGSLQFLGSHDQIDRIILLDKDGNRMTHKNQEIVFKRSND